MSDFSFQLGFSQVKQRDIKDVKQKIMLALGINTRSSWLMRLNGVVEPKVSEAKAIEEIFAEYGITEVWGNE